LYDAGANQITNNLFENSFAVTPLPTAIPQNHRKPTGQIKRDRKEPLKNKKK
jgi:hypothetical protein